MKPCPSCDRHLRSAERACPFCGARARDVVAPAWAVLTLATVFVGCIDPLPDDVGPSDGSSTGAAPVSGTGMIDPPTANSETAEDDAMADSSGDDATGGGFIYGSPDAGTSPPSACDVFAQDCSAGEKCMPWANDGGGVWNATRCSPIAEDPGQPGDPCTVEGSGVSGIDDCDEGVMCWGVDAETSMGTCVAMCTGSPVEPVCDDPATECMISNEGVLILCLPTCDPLLQDCIDGQACYPANDDFFCAPDVSGDQGAYGDECAFINTCDSGLMCHGPWAVPGCMGSGCCTVFCDVTDPAGDAQCPDAAGGQQCLAFFTPGQGPPEHADLGACVVPES